MKQIFSAGYGNRSPEQFVALLRMAARWQKTVCKKACHDTEFSNKSLIFNNKIGDPERIRTSDLQIRNLPLYPTELRGR